MRAGRVVLATGAIERPIVFPNNDRPGVMLASSARHYLNRFGVIAGRKIVIFTNNDDAYRTALDYLDAGLEITAVVDVREKLDGELPRKLIGKGVRVITGHAVDDVKGARGVKAVSIAPLIGPDMGGTSEIIPCDLLCVSGGWSPTVHLFSQSGGKLKFDEEKCAFVPDISRQNEISVGAAKGDGLVKLYPFWQVPTNRRDVANAKRYVDFLHDVTAEDVALAARENFRSVEHFKRYTTTGMAPDQGRTSNVNGLALLAQETNRPISEVGTTKFRPPYMPVTMGALAAARRGELYSPVMKLALHDWHLAQGALMEDYGGWQRPVCYPRSGESEEGAVHREVLNVRTNVGLLDYSPLGKIDVRGPDSAVFLERIYANSLKNLKVGRARYGLFLNEHGAIMDDGVAGRLAVDHFMVTTTSSGAAPMVGWMEEWLQCEWPDLDVVITPLTTGWGTISLSGPHARKVLSKLDMDMDIRAENMPHMSVRTGHVEGIEARIFRVSFTGEMGFEISVPRSYTRGIWEKIYAAGQEFGLQPFGLEALMILRTEKGFIHVGVDTDSTNIPDDVGFGGAVGKKQGDFIGRRSLSRPHETRTDREQIVGLRSAKTLPIGGQIVPDRHTSRPVPMEGRVTSSYWSPVQNRPVALGLLKAGRKRLGERVVIFHRGDYFDAEVVAPCSYDPKGEKING